MFNYYEEPSEVKNILLIRSCNAVIISLCIAEVWYLKKKLYIYYGLGLFAFIGLTSFTINKIKQKNKSVKDIDRESLTISAFDCYDGTPVPPEYYSNVEDLIKQLKALQSEIGGKIKIVSGYRTPTHNTKVGGVANSQHLVGMGADFRSSTTLTPTEVANTIENLISKGKMKQGGIGIYPNYVHYDTRGTRARWTEGCTPIDEACYN